LSARVAGVTFEDVRAAVDVRAARGESFARLDRFVDRIDVMRPRAGESRRSVDFLPDGTTTLVLRVLAEGVADGGVRGPLTRAYYKTAPAIPLTVRVVFRPGGAYPFFGVPIERLTDRYVALGDLWGAGAARLGERLLGASARTSTVEDWMTCAQWGLANVCATTSPTKPANCVALDVGCYGGDDSVAEDAGAD
jgi:hypothetical protein